MPIESGLSKIGIRNATAHVHEWPRCKPRELTREYLSIGLGLSAGTLLSVINSMLIVAVVLTFPLQLFPAVAVLENYFHIGPEASVGDKSPQLAEYIAHGVVMKPLKRKQRLRSTTYHAPGTPKVFPPFVTRARYGCMLRCEWGVGWALPSPFSC